MINSTEMKYRNNVPFNAQTVPNSQVGQPMYSPAMQGVQDTYVANRIKNADYGWATIPIGIGTWFGICQGMDYFNNKLCSKEYMETPFGKLGAWGDKVSNNYFNSSFAKSDFGKSLHKFLGDSKTYINKKIANNKVLSALKFTPAQPENSFVIPQSKGLLGYHNMEINDLIPSFLEQSEVPAQLERYGMEKADIDRLKTSLKGKKKADRMAALLREEYKIFGVSSEEALKAAKAKAMGFNSLADFEKYVGYDGKKTIEYPREIMKALENADPKMKIVRWRGEGRMSWLTKLMGRDITFKELANKYKVVGIDSPHTTKLGRGLSQGLGWVMEGMTNRFAGGKFMAIMQATALAGATVAALNATGAKEKAKTFIEQNVNLFSFIFAAPLAITAMFRVGGMKYAGMTPEQVTKFREELKLFNEKVDAGAFKNKDAYKAAKKNLTNMLQGDTKNGFFTKMFKKVGEFMNVGNEKIKPYKSLANNNMNFFRKMGYWTKNAAGYPLRFGLAMFVLMPFVSKVITKASNAIFGKPKNSVLDEGTEEQTAKDENVNAQLARLRQDAIQRQQAVAQHQQAVQANANSPRMDMLTKYKQNQNHNSSHVVNNTTNIYNNQASQEDKQPEPVRTYIPSPVGVQVQMPNMDPANAAMQRSMQAEAEALKMLSM